MNGLHSFDKRSLVDVTVNVYAVALRLSYGIVHHLIVLLYEVVIQLAEAFQQIVLLLLGELVPDLRADDVNVRGVLMLGVGVGLDDLLMLVNGQSQLSVLCTVHDALLQRGVRFTCGHRNGRTAHSFNHIHGSGADHGTNLFAFQHGGRSNCHIVFQIEVARTIAIISDCDVACILRGVEQLTNDLTVCHCIVVVFLPFEQVRQREDGVAVIELAQRICADFCHVQNTGLHQLDHGRFRTQNTTGIDRNFHVHALIFGHQIGQIRDRAADLGIARLTVRQPELDLVIANAAVYLEKGGNSDSQQHDDNDGQQDF